MYTAVAGTRITADSRVPRDSWAATSRYRCSAANADMRGSSAVMIETATMPCAIMKMRYALLKIIGPGPPRSAAIFASRSTTSNATWLTATYTSIQEPTRPSSRTRSSRQSQRHRQRNATLRSAGSSPAACTRMPSVVPTPSTRICPVVTRWGDSSRAFDQIRMNAPAMAITTALFRIGVHIGAAKWPRVLRIAASSAAIP